MADAPKPRDFWDKFTIVLQPLGGLLTALAVTVVGVKGSRVLDRRQSVDTNARLYSELMSRREESESSLRKDMFNSIISSFLQPSKEDLDGKILNLELLAYNFNDSLNLKPLFLDIQRRIQKATPSPDREAFRLRINRVARETTAKQLFSLLGQGRSFTRSVDFDELAAAGGAGLPLDPEMVTVHKSTSEVRLRVLKVDKDQEQLFVRLEVRFPGSKPELPDTRAAFNVGYFDFPVIDNTRLANGLRCAVTLTNYSPAAADLTTVCFPGEYASLKDRPYYDEVIQKLKEANEDEAAPMTDGNP